MTSTTPDPQEARPPTRARLFGAGVLGLPVAVATAAALELALRAGGSDGVAPTAFFAAVAGLVPVVALGLLVQLLTALTRRTRSLMQEVRLFDEEMSGETPELVEQSHQQRTITWLEARLFVHVVVPFGAGVIVQLVVTLAVAVWCLVADVDDRFPALALGGGVVALFVYLLFFGRMLARLTQLPAAAVGDSGPSGSPR